MPTSGVSSGTSVVASCPEALVAALDELDVAWREAMADPAFVVRVRDHPPGVRRHAQPALPRRAPLGPGRSPHPAQARGPQPHRRPQDPQRAGPGAADQADGQDPGHRRDRGRPARCRQRHRGCLLRARLHRLHGRGGHPPPGPQRGAHAAAGSHGDPRRGGQRHPEGRHQRGPARLGRQRRPHGVPLRHGRRAAPVPEHGARLLPRHRRRGAGAVPGSVRPAARRGGRVCRRRVQRDRHVHRLPARRVRRDPRLRAGRRRGRDRAPRSHHPRR